MQCNQRQLKQIFITINENMHKVSFVISWISDFRFQSILQLIGGLSLQPGNCTLFTMTSAFDCVTPAELEQTH